MARILSIFLGLLVLSAAGGCATEAPAQAHLTPLGAPWTGLYTPLAGPLSRATTAQPSLLADGDIYIPRGEKYVSGALSLSSVSASSVYTYEAEPVALPGGWGYRYRSVVQSTVTVP